MFFFREFGDYYSKAIEESWYKSAVLQHRIDPNSFVYSVPHDEDADKFELKITASHAIFHRDGIKEVPSCVVGFQFTYGLMYKRFMQITSEKQVFTVIKRELQLSIFNELYISV